MILPVITDLLMYFACGPFAEKLPIFAQNRVLISATACPQTQIIIIVYSQDGREIPDHYKDFVPSHLKNITFCTISDLKELVHINDDVLGRINYSLGRGQPAITKDKIKLHILSNLRGLDSRVRTLTFADLDFALVVPSLPDDVNIKALANLRFYEHDVQSEIDRGTIELCSISWLLLTPEIGLTVRLGSAAQESFAYLDGSRFWGVEAILKTELFDCLGEDYKNTRASHRYMSAQIRSFFTKALTIERDSVAYATWQELTRRLESREIFLEGLDMIPISQVAQIIGQVLIHDKTYIAHVAGKTGFCEDKVMRWLQAVQKTLEVSGYDVAVDAIVTPKCFSWSRCDNSDPMDEHGICVEEMKANISALMRHSCYQSGIAKSESARTDLERILIQSCVAEELYKEKFIADVLSVSSKLNDTTFPTAVTSPEEGMESLSV